MKNSLDKIQIKSISEEDLTEEQRKTYFKFEQDCFEEDLSEVRKNLYFSIPIYHLILEKDGQLASYLRVFTRQVLWDGKQIKIAGIGSVATKQAFRSQGLATQLLKEAMKILKSEKASFALLQTDLPRGEKLYGSVGFILFGREYTFLDASNKKHTAKAKDVMVAPIVDAQILEEIKNSSEILNIGKGNW